MAKVVRHSNIEKMQVLSYNTLALKDIQILCDCGLNKARELKKKYFDYILQKNIKLFHNEVYTDLFIEALNIDTQRIERYAKKGY